MYVGTFGCSRAHISMNAHPHVSMWSLWLALSDLVNHYPPSILRQSLLLTLELPTAASLANQLAPEISYLYLLHTEITGWHLSHWVLRRWDMCVAVAQGGKRSLRATYVLAALRALGSSGTD